MSRPRQPDRRFCHLSVTWVPSIHPTDKDVVAKACPMRIGAHSGKWVVRTYTLEAIQEAAELSRSGRPGGKPKPADTGSPQNSSVPKPTA